MNNSDRITGPFPLDSEGQIEGILGKMRTMLGAPLIYSLFGPMVFFDLCMELYHQVCFSVFAIPKVDRKKYFIYDRYKLPGLNWFEKLNCLYCDYFNGLVSYAREIGGRTERHWCPIKHAIKRQHEHAHYAKFFDESSADRYQREKKLLRLYDPNVCEQFVEEYLKRHQIKNQNP